MNFFTILGILFIGLKLTHFIDWSWWLVLLPIYGGLLFILIVALFTALFLRSR